MIGIIIGIVLGAAITWYAMRGYMHWRLCVEADHACIVALHDIIRLRKAALVWERARGLHTAPALARSITTFERDLKTTQAHYDEMRSTPFVYRLLYGWRDSGISDWGHAARAQSRQVAIAIVEETIDDASKQTEARSAPDQPPTTMQAP